MKHFLLFLLLFVSASAFGQTIFSAGITYCNGAPSHNPGNTGSRYAIDTSSWDLYVRSYGTTWSKAGDWLQFRTGTGTPAAPPTKFESVFAINASDSLYYYDGATWKHLNPASTGGVTGSGLANRLAYWTASGVIGYESTLRVDSTNNRLMIGAQTAPEYPVHVKTTVNESLHVESSNTSSTSFTVENTAGGATTRQWAFATAGTSNQIDPGMFAFYNYEADQTLMAIGAKNRQKVALAQNTILGFSRGNVKYDIDSLDAGIKRSAARLIDISDGTASGLGSLRLNTIYGKGSTSATWSLRAANNLDSVVIYALDNRRVGINTTTPDVSFDMGDNTDGFKMQAGTTAQRPSVNNTQRVNSDSTKAEIRLNGTWETINSGLRSNKALDFPSTAASSYSDLTLTVTGAAVGDVCSVGVPAAGQIANVSYSCFVSATNVVTVRLLNNEAAGVADPTSGTFKVFVTK